MSVPWPLALAPEAALLQDLLGKLRPNKGQVDGVSKTRSCDCNRGTMDSCTHWVIYGQRCSFTKPHADILGGTWVRNLSGLKLWPLCFNLTKEELDAFKEQGPDWKPSPEKVRSVLIREGEYLIMPPNSM